MRATLPPRRSARATRRARRGDPEPPGGAGILACARALLLPVALLAATPAASLAQEFEEEIRATEARLDAARAEGLHLMAPRYFERAVQRLGEARERYGRGDAIRGARAALEGARDALAAAERLREPGRATFGEALAAREGALAADAPNLAPAPWREAEEEIREGGRRLERGDREGAVARAAVARSAYRRAELEAIRTDVLGRAREERGRAVQSGAPEGAPATFAEAEGRLVEADRVLAGDRTRLSEAGRLGQAAARGYRRATRIALTADSVRRRWLGVEEVVRRHEEEVARLAEPLLFEPDLSEGVPAVAEEALAAIRSLQEDRANLQSELAEREAELAESRARADDLEGRLAGLERREAELAAELRERQRKERRLREVRAIFTPEEGEVLVRGDSLAIRLYGLTFATGSAEIRPELFSLLTKLQRVLREFPDAPVLVEGHTDSQGNDDANRALSQRRAIAVREHLLANMPISSTRISAVGRGEDRPIATNDTAEGRERNRRIEVVLDISGGS